jgi:hypothetical protein
MNNIIQNGTRVISKCGAIEGITKGVVIRGVSNNSIEYHIGYFANGDYKEIWLFDFELDIKIDNSEPVGFAKSTGLCKI